MPRKSIEEQIEELALSVAGGFHELHEKIDRRFAQIDRRFDQTDSQLEQIQFEVSGQDRRLSILEDKVRIISHKIGLDAPSSK